MVNKCCVPACKGNYRNGKKVSVFKFPKDTELRKKWIRSIRRENFTPSEHSVVCEEHFVQSDPILHSTAVDWKTGTTLTVHLEKLRLKEGAVPCLLPNCASYFNFNQGVEREAPNERRDRPEAVALRTAIAESIQTATAQQQKLTFHSFDEFEEKINNITLSEQWSAVTKQDCVLFLYFDFNKTPHDFIYILVSRDLNLKVYIKGVEVVDKFPQSVNSVTEIENVLKVCTDLIGSKDNSLLLLVIHSLLDTLQVKEGKRKVVSFLKSQTELCLQPKVKHKFDSETMVVCSVLLFISPHAYKFLRSSGLIIVPHPNTLRKRSCNINVNPSNPNFLSHLKVEISCLAPHERFVTLMLDEIYIKPYLDYKGGNIAGMSFDAPDLATSAHVFMIQSILSSFKSVVHILPVRKITAESLFNVLKTVVVGLETVGFKIVSLVSDNNSINRKSVSYFAQPPQVSFVYLSPIDKKRPLFFLNDAVHIFKCIRNNWINLKNYRQTFCYPDFDNVHILRHASFAAVRELYDLESQKLLKYGYGVSVKALWPSSLERQNVKFVTQVFSENVESGLIELGPLHNLENWEDTAKFIHLIRVWWNILNVKTPLKGINHRDEMQKPLTNKAGDIKYNFLDKFITWLDEWKNVNIQSGKLSHETHAALRLTTYGLMQLTEYCCGELEMSYILPGKFQTDSLEARFGLYRRLSGCQYHISLRQLLESEKKLQLMKTLELNVHPEKKLKIVELNCNDVSPDSSAGNIGDMFPNFSINDSDFTNIESDIPVLTYIAGYCCHSLIKNLQCSQCADFLIVGRPFASEMQFSLIKQLDRGNLKFPRKFPVTIVSYSYVVLQKLLMIASFMRLQNQRAVATDVIYRVVADNDFLYENCCAQHSLSDLCRKIMWITVNIVLNNYCKKKNNEISVQAFEKSKKRKLQTYGNL